MKPLSRHPVLALLMSLLLLRFPADTAEAAPIPLTKPDFAAVDQYVSTQMNRLGIPGLELGIVHGNQVVHLQGFGISDSSGRAVTPQTPFQIGSVTKPFTALAVMQLVEQGKIDLDAPVKEYLPWFKLADKNAAAQITVRNLMNHASGLSTTEGNRLWPSQQTPEEAVRGLNTWSLARPVGTTYQYSNVNYTIAGLIVEKVSGESFSDYVTQHIFGPLDMRHSYASRAAALAGGLSAGHYYVLGRAFQANGPLPPPYLPSGMLISTADDLSHFAIAQLNNGQYGNTTVLSPDGIDQMHTPAIPMMVEDYRYAIGWAVGTFDGMPVLRHDGDTGRFHAMLLLEPGQRWGVILLANASGFVEISQVDDIAKNVLLMLHGRATGPVSPPAGMRLLYWAILFTPMLQAMALLYGLRQRRSGARLSGWLLVTSALLNLAVGYLFLFLLPGYIIPFEIAPLLQLYPEVGLALLIGAGLGGGEAAACAWLYVRSRQHHHVYFRLHSTKQVNA